MEQKKKKRVKNPWVEDEEQKRFVQWLDGTFLKDYYFMIPNESGKRNFGLMMRLKQMGFKRGVPDMMICYPSIDSNSYGLFIELKKSKEHGGGRVSEPQKEWLDKLNRVGYEAVVAYGCDDAIEKVKEYLGEYLWALIDKDYKFAEGASKYEWTTNLTE